MWPISGEGNGGVEVSNGPQSHHPLASPTWSRARWVGPAPSPPSPGYMEDELKSWAAIRPAECMSIFLSVSVCPSSKGKSQARNDGVVLFYFSFCQVMFLVDVEFALLMLCVWTGLNFLTAIVTGASPFPLPYPIPPCHAVTTAVTWYRCISMGRGTRTGVTWK